MPADVRQTGGHTPVDASKELFAAVMAVAAVHLDVDDAAFFGAVTATVARIVDARRVVFGLLDGEGALAIHPGTFGVPGRIDGSAVACVPAGTGVLEDIVYRGSLYCGRFIEPAESAPWHELLGGLNVHDAVVVNWSAGDERLGLAAAFDSASPGSFTEAHVRLLQIAAATVGLVWKHKVTNDHCQVLYHESQALNESIRSMVDMIVHEFRSPLTVLYGYADMLATGAFGDLPVAAEAPLKAMMAKTAELSDHVEALLLVAQLEAGAIPAAVSPFDLCQTVAAATAAAEPLADLGGAKIVLETLPRPVTAVADADHVRLILNNLLANALHYGGPHPEIRVVVSADPAPMVTVMDPGGGIPQEMQERIFERFVRVVGRTTPPGSGLGLYLSRQLAERSGGQLRLDRSDRATGTAFSLLLRGIAATATRPSNDS